MIALPIFLQMVLEYSAMWAGLSIAPLSLTMFVVALLAGKRAGGRRPSTLIIGGVRRPRGRGRRPDRGRPPGRYRLVPPGPAGDRGAGLGLLVSQLNNYTLSPISEERVSEAAGVNSAGGSFGLSFGLLSPARSCSRRSRSSFTSMANDSTVLPPDDKEQVAEALEEDAQVMSNTALDELLVDEPPAVSDEVIRINTEARPFALR